MVDIYKKYGLEIGIAPSENDLYPLYLQLGVNDEAAIVGLTQADMFEMIRKLKSLLLPLLLKEEDQWNRLRDLV